MSDIPVIVATRGTPNCPRCGARGTDITIMADCGKLQTRWVCTNYRDGALWVKGCGQEFIAKTPVAGKGEK